MNQILEIMEPYPLEQIIPVEKWLKNTDLTPYFGDNARRGWRYQFTGSLYIPFTRYLSRLDYKESAEWTEFCERIFPLIEYMQRQISKQRGREYKPKVAEINILPAGGRILPHVDQASGSDIMERVHLVLYTNHNALFTIDNKTKHFPQGSCFVFDNTVLHDVVNNSTTSDRAHLVVDFGLD
jgi:hypothetical protein